MCRYSLGVCNWTQESGVRNRFCYSRIYISFLCDDIVCIVELDTQIQSKTLIHSHQFSFSTLTFVFENYL
ncbi:hypothetical protein AR158_c410R [Paramecium bursaria Chlorella virus AR158]|uniref:hypothetical protein n=1 Tax=Paramecium bursaria Chlorella virus AR158 TaxID=380598 RepID=UPI00015AA6C2|nr:hypothetical protein AR158_c410R [Paramecium bursaria Chlorella virus AR158]ABU43955.1 hypothetical protein AR158_c410R [Paramecium bursaria Chlorella virus AR158]